MVFSGLTMSRSPIEVVAGFTVSVNPDTTFLPYPAFGNPEKTTASGIVTGAVNLYGCRRSEAIDQWTCHFRLNRRANSCTSGNQSDANKVDSAADQACEADR